MNFPRTFGAVGAHTPVLRTYEEAPAYTGSSLYFVGHTPVTRSCTFGRGTPTRCWIVVGAQDPWFAKALAFHQELIALHVPHEWHMYPGEHSGLYWGAHVGDYPGYYGSVLGRS